MMNSYLRRKRVSMQNTNLEPPRVGWRNLLAQWVMTGVFAIFLMGSILPLNALASDYKVQVRFMDMFNQTATGLTVTANGKTATLNGNYYVITGLSENSYTLTMSTPGYKTVTCDFSVGSNHPSHNCGNFYAVNATNGYRIEGRTIDASGSVLAGVKISFDGKQTTSDASGNFGIDFSTAGSYTLTFEKSDHLTVTKGFYVSDSKPRYPIGNVRVITGYTVTGIVQDIDQQPFAGVSVQVGDQSATTGSDGSYTVTGILSHGSHTLTLSKSGKTLTRSISISESQPVYPMYTLYMVDAYIIYGGVYDVYNQPIAGFNVEADGNSATTDATGKYQVMVSSVGTHTVTLKQSGYKEVTTSGSVSDTTPNNQAKNNLYAISTTDGYRIEGSVNLVDSAVPFSQVTVTLGDLTATPDSDGKFELKGLLQPDNHNLTVTVANDGYVAMSRQVSVYDHEPYHVLGAFNFAPSLKMALNTSSSTVQQGGTIAYTVSITNNGYGPAGYVKMWTTQPLPECIHFVSATPIDDPLLANYNVAPTGETSNITNDCDITDETKILDCKYLGTLGGKKTTQMKVVVSVGCGTWKQPSPFSLSFAASGMPCQNCSNVDDQEPIEAPPIVKFIPVEPFLSLSINGGPSQVEVGESLSYTLKVSNSEKAPSAVTNTILQIALPDLVELASITPEQGNCSGTGTTLTCNLDTLPNNSITSVALVLQSKLVGQGKIGLDLTSKQAPSIQKNSSNFMVVSPPPPPPPIPVGDADLMFVIDDTGSMGEELGQIAASISEFISVYGQTGPNVGLVTFKDNVTNRITNNSGALAATNNMSWLLNGYGSYVKGIKQLNADLGADCPEASLEALDYAKDQVKIGGRMILVTDASPHTGAVDIDKLITDLLSKGIRVDIILSGDECIGRCGGVSTGDDIVSAIEIFSRIAKETGGLFATPFEVNDGSNSGTTRYRKVALNMMRSTVSPTVTMVMPNFIPQGVTLDLTILSANTSFNANSEVSFGDDIKVNSVEVLSSTKMRVNVTVPESIGTGFRDINVVTQQGEDTSENAQGLGVLEIVAASDQPSILSVTPESVSRNGTATIKVIGMNTNFGSGTNLSFGDSGITVQSLTANSKTALTAIINIPSDANLGQHAAEVTSGSEVITTACSIKASPATASLLVTPSLDESPIPRLTEVDPERGTQGALRELDIKGVNTTFVQDVSELRIGDKNDIYILELTILSETEAKALIQIDAKAELGYRDVFMYTDDEFVSLLDGFEVTQRGPCSVEGYVTNQLDEPVANLELDTGVLLGFSDESGYFQITGLWEGEHELAIEGSGYSDVVEFIVSDNTAINGDASSENCMVPLQIEVGGSDLSIEIKQDSWTVYQGDTLTYTITVTNNGSVTATGVSFTDLLPKSASFVSTNLLDGGNCVTNEDEHSVTCNLLDLAPNQSATVKIQVKVDQIIKGGSVNTVTVDSIEYPPDVKKSWATFLPYLSVHIKDNPDPVMPGGGLHYIITVELSQYASSAATEVKLVSYLPAGLELKSVSSSDDANCDTSNFPTITCDVVDLDVSSPESISQVEVDINVVLKDPGLLLLINEAQVSAKGYSIYKEKERTKVYIPPDYQVDLALVIDVTGSMQPEMNGTKNAVNNFIEALKAQSQDSPLTALVVFRDEVTLKAVTTDLSLVEKAINDMEASGGGTCPEASVEALDVATTHVKKGGTIFFVTDASPYEDADMTTIFDRIKTKEINLNAVVTGDCSNQDSWNPISQ